MTLAEHLPVGVAQGHGSLTGTMYRMPIAFGPSLGPRQGPEGRRFDGEPSKTTSFTLTFLGVREQLEQLLPPGHSIDGEPIARVNVSYVSEIPWLAGRAYNMFEVVIPTVYRGLELETGEQVEVGGDLVTVMWESLADALMTGREEFGAPKLYADIPPVHVGADGTTTHAEWDGFRFAEITLDGLQLGEWPTEREADAPIVPSAEPRARFYYKYMPRTRAWGEADACYTTMTVPSQYPPKVVETWSGTGTALFHRARWEDLPTFAQVANGLADLEIVEYRGASMRRAISYFADLRNQRVFQ